MLVCFLVLSTQNSIMEQECKACSNMYICERITELTCNASRYMSERIIIKAHVSIAQIMSS